MSCNQCASKQIQRAQNRHEIWTAGRLPAQADEHNAELLTWGKIKDASKKTAAANSNSHLYSYR